MILYIELKIDKVIWMNKLHLFILSFIFLEFRLSRSNYEKPNENNIPKHKLILQMHW